MWERKKIEEKFYEILEDVKRFLTSKDLLIFLFFLLITAFLWLLEALRKNYETVIQIPISYVNLPNDYIITNELPQKTRITITGRGTSLLNYRYGKDFDSVKIDVSRFISRKRELFHTRELMDPLKKQIKDGIQIERIYPDTIRIKVAKQEEKVVPIKLNAEIELSQQYCFCDTLKMVPSELTIYGPREVLDSISFAETDSLILFDVKDTLRPKVTLKKVPNITFSRNDVELFICTEPFTEKSVDAPILISNLPQTRNLRIFPSTATVHYQIGLSSYDKIDASSFSIEVDYNETALDEDSKLTIHLKKSPKEAFNIKIKPTSTDYIIEEKQNK